MKWLLISTIWFYQRLAPAREIFLLSIGIAPHQCRYSPSCSEYAKKAIRTYGTIPGLIKAFKRLSSCYPSTKTSLN